MTNKGNAVDTFNLVVDTSSLPTGWDASLDQDKISNLGVDDNITLTDVLVVKAPDDAAAESETSIIVTISSDYNASVNSTYTSRTTVLQNYEPKISIVGEDTMAAKAEEQVNFTIKIANDGNGEDDISLSLIGGNASWGQLGDSAFTLAAGTNDTTTLRVTPPKDTEAKNGYILVVRATSEDGVTTNSRNSFINVDQIFEVSVQVSGDSSKKGDPGDELTYSITVKNKGNGEDTVSLALEGDKSSWASIVDEVELTRGETKTVNLTVNIDDDATSNDFIGIDREIKKYSDLVFSLKEQSGDSSEQKSLWDEYHNKIDIFHTRVQKKRIQSSVRASKNRVEAVVTDFEKTIDHVKYTLVRKDLNAAKKSLKKLQATINEAQITGQKDEGYSEWLEKQTGKYKEYDASINEIDLKIDIEQHRKALEEAQPNIVKGINELNRNIEGHDFIEEQLEEELDEEEDLWDSNQEKEDVSHDEKNKEVKKQKTSSLKLITEIILYTCLLYTSPSPRDGLLSRMPSSA